MRSWFGSSSVAVTLKISQWQKILQVEIHLETVKEDYARHPQESVLPFDVCDVLAEFYDDLESIMAAQLYSK